MGREQGKALPEMWGNQKAVYYCPYCESVPSVGEGEIAVGKNHSECMNRAVDMAIAELSAYALEESTAALVKIVRSPKSHL